MGRKILVRVRDGRGANARACFAVAIILLATQVAAANKKAASLPSAVLAARTIYIENQTTDGGLRNNAYLGLAKWGHLQVVDASEKADVVLVLTGSSFVKAVSAERPTSTSGGPSGTTGAAGPAGAGARTPVAAFAVLPTGYEAAPDGFTRLTLVDGKTGATVWSDLSKTNNAQSASHIVDGLREAFEQGAKSR